VRARRSKEKKEEEATKPGAVLVGLVYIIIAATIAYFLSGLVIQQVDLYQLLGLYDIELPLIKVPGGDIPQWVLQLVLGALIFFLLQPFIVIVTGLLSRGEQEEPYERSYRNPWER